MSTHAQSPLAFRTADRPPRLVDALAKLNPRMMMRNPVMFVVEIGSVLTTVLC